MFVKLNMFSIFRIVFIFLNALFVTHAEELYGPHPRIAANNGHLTIYGALHKNVSIQTSGTGVINLNGENLQLITKDVRQASEAVKRMENGVIDPFMSTITRISELIEGPYGLEKRVSFLENNSTAVSGSPSRDIGRYRNFQTLSRRVRTLEIKMTRILKLLNKNECGSNPCKNGGKCQDIFNGYICQCTDAWEGPLCDIDVNECLRFVGTDLGCQNGATCVNKPGSYECLCPPGWFGIHCVRKTNDCNKESVQELCGHGTCVPQNTAIGYKCLCDQGWTTDGVHPTCTVDVNECDSPKPHCSVNPQVTCINVPGTFYCGNCPQGYTGNGFYCTDIDECLTSNGGCSMLPKVQCINTLGSRICGSCPPGYVGDGVICNYRGVCQVDNGGCHPLARCFDNPHIGSNYVQCICPAGYAGFGVGTNGCVRSSLVPYADPCESNPCVHGTCTNIGNSTFSCTCLAGYTGKTCNVLGNACISNPCQNGGKCTSTGTQYVCECSNSYTGLNCENERQACGGKLTGEVGFLKFPENNSTYYSHGISCSWVIQTVANLVLNITFTEFHVEESNDCLFDWLQIHDGSNSAAHIVGRFCGTQLPNNGQIVSARNTIYIWFRSDHSVAKSGFALKWHSVPPVCGGFFSVKSHGIIKSPGFPGNYPPLRDCFWLLMAPFGKRLEFHFFTLMIGNNPNCNFDYLEVYSGMSLQDSKLASYCNTSHPEPLVTTTSTAMVYFHSDATGNYPGFQISYSVIEGFPGCGGTFTLEQGEISSPSNDQQYLPNLDCEYKIRVPKTGRIKITFLSFALESSPNCRYDYVMIREGGKADSPLVGTYCGAKLPPSYTSTGNELYIKLKTDFSSHDNGFRLKYETVCGGIYSNPTGVIKSPRYPFQYSNSKNCIYEIVQPLGTSIALKFGDFDIEATSYPDCFHDYLEIRDGDNENSTLIGRYCGNFTVAPSEVLSTHNYLWLKFHSDTSFTAKGFIANYSTIDLKCGGILKENLGIIKSPGYPEKYLSGLKCSWVLVAPPGFIIQITWINFNLETSLRCVLDYVSVYDNNTDTSMGGLIGKYCGKKMPPTLLSSSNIVTINFVSDNTLTYDGFIANYNFLDERKVCGGKYFTGSGVIRSPNYPNNYPPHKDCSWIITVPNGQQIMLNITDFKLEQYEGCRSDYLEIRNGAFESSPLIGVFCGTSIPRQIPSHTNSLFVKFHSDASKSKSGFQIYWDGTTRGCGGRLYSPSGIIISPNYPQPYGQNELCYWKIITSAGSVLQMVFTDIELENQARCTRDYVQIYDGSETIVKSLGRFCWETQTTSFIKTTNNQALIRFRSDVSRQGRGFQLKYLTNCNNTLTGFRGIIKSPNFPNPYPRGQDCTWTIIAPRGNKINITFSHFDIEQNDVTSEDKPCKFDYIEIQEGELGELEEILLEKYCGRDIPSLISSTKDIVYVHFVTDNLVQGAGFRLEWVVEGCGGILTHPTGELITPGYPYGYPSDTDCEWLIEVDFNSSIELTINKFDMEKSMDCTYDSVEIFNGPDEQSPSLTKLCHTNPKPIKVTSTGNIMFVKFISDSSYTGRGFTATYKTVPIQCGGKYVTPSGSIHSQNYPKNYKNNEDCFWLIQVAEDHIINLNFHEFDLASSTNCTEDFVKIYDGIDENGDLLLHHCGNTIPNDTISSTRNSLYVRMKTDSFVTAKGFLANYTTACGAQIVTDGNGMINFMDWYNWECEWTIIAENPEKHVSLTINHMEISINCDEPTLKIYEGTNSEGPVIGSYCGTKVPPTIVSKGSALHMELISAYGTSLRATYSVLSTSCGGELTSLNGYFASLGYPDNYPMNAECEWRIHLAPGNKVLVTFIQFDIIESEYCNADFVEVRENNAGGKLLGTYCGKEIPSNLTETSSLWIQFRSSEIGTAKGFLAEYNLIHGNELFGSRGEIGSPLYPNIFTQMEEFFWRITVDLQNVIQINFKDFYVDWYAGEDCFLLGLEIYDGYDNMSPLLSKLCSIKKPEPVISSSNVVYIQYYVSSFRYSLKFLLEWVQVQKPRTVKDLSKTLSVDDCGSNSVIDLSLLNNYTLQSPGYPLGYAGNLKCEWTFSTSVENHLSIEFLAMNLEGNDPKCVMDSVTVYSGINGEPDWQIMDTLCLRNATDRSAIHTSNLMKIVFKTDMYVNGTGFSAYINTECGGSLKGPNGVISLSNNKVTGEYARTLICAWNVTVKTGRTIEIKFLEFNIKSQDERVCSNYLMLRNGIYRDSPLLGNGKYCGDTLPQVNITSGNSLSVKYSGFYQRNKFKLVYKEVSLACGGTIKIDNDYNSTEISSPNYPNIPPPHTECIWIITVPPGESVQIDFIERFDVTRSVNCVKAGVELRDGGTTLSPLIGIYCNNIPSTQKSNDSILYVRFYTDVTDPKNGFKAKVMIATCGGVIRGQVGSLTSPQYPASFLYVLNSVCTWRIIGPVDHYLTLTFDDFHFPYRSNCTLGSYLTIKETNIFGNETSLGVFCGRKKPADIRSSSNEVIIKLVSGAQRFAFRGFKITYNASQETCGGRIEAESGTITSPNYPVSNHYNRNCEWLIVVPRGRRVIVNILDFDMAVNSLYDRGLAFFNSKMVLSYISHKYGKDDTKVIKSSTNLMLVYFWSSGMTRHRGFKLNFKSDEPTICVGDLNKDNGVLTAPKENVTTYFCDWERSSDINANLIFNRSLSFIINTPKIGSSTVRNCKLSSSRIIVTSEGESSNVAQLCGTLNSPVIVRTPYLNTKLEVYQGRYHDKFNFTITYKVQPCGGILTSSYGTITSPGYPVRYKDSVDCAWLVKLEEGQSIKINFTFMELDPSCTKDYITIHNGPLPSSPKIGHYCGTKLPAFVQSQSNSLWIDYHAAIGGSGNGFSLMYEPVTSGCGGIFHDRDRIISSPNYPMKYPNNVECLWEIQSPEGFHIGLKFVDRYQIEDSINCTNDFIQIWDYKDEDWISLGRICGRNKPDAFNSTMNRMKILFRSNSNLTANGFKATWHFNCGGSFTATEAVKYIVSPGYPMEYTSMLNCKYDIKGKYVNLIFDEFNLEEGYLDCRYDNVSIYRNRYHSFIWTNNRSQLNTMLIGRYCGTNKPPPFRYPKGLTIVFATDKWVNRKGFKLRYFLDKCGGSVNKEGEISSPIAISGKHSYYGSSNCIWNITAPVDKIIIIKFQFFELEYHRKCQYDFVELYNGYEFNRKERLATLCGNITAHLPVIRSTSNKMIIRLRTDMSNQFRGFKSTVIFTYGEKVGCGGTVNLTTSEPTKVLRSPDIDHSGQYLPDLDCQWLIIAPGEETIELIFSNLHLDECANSTESDKCNCDYLQIRDGGGSLSELITQVCGHNLPKKIISSGNQLWIRMVTDSVRSSTGFIANIKKVLSPCGPSLLQVTNKAQHLSSPNYPNNYPTNIRCMWILKTKSSFVKIDIYFKELELQNSNSEDQCNTDKLQIYDTNNLHTISEGLGENFVFAGPRTITHLTSRLSSTSYTYCGKVQPTDYHSTRNEVMISFISDGSITAKGFQLEYREAGCNRNYTAIQGHIVHERFFNECYTMIEAPPNHTISLYFQAFLLLDSQSCRLSGIEIHDGNSSSGIQLAKLCGYQSPNPVFSNGNVIWMHAYTFRQGLGMYNIIYTTTDKGRGCGGIINNYSGKFTSPMYPVNYRSNSVCRWDITVPRGLQVALRFSIFDLGPGNTCSTTFVELLDINVVTGEETVSTKYCASDQPAMFTASRNKMALRYTSSVSNAGTGWVASFIGKTTDTDLHFFR